MQTYLHSASTVALVVCGGPIVTLLAPSEPGREGYCIELRLRTWIVIVPPASVLGQVIYCWSAPPHRARIIPVRPFKEHNVLEQYLQNITNLRLCTVPVVPILLHHCSSADPRPDLLQSTPPAMEGHDLFPRSPFFFPGSHFSFSPSSFPNRPLCQPRREVSRAPPLLRLSDSRHGFILPTLCWSSIGSARIAPPSLVSSMTTERNPATLTHRVRVRKASSGVEARFASRRSGVEGRYHLNSER